VTEYLCLEAWWPLMTSWYSSSVSGIVILTFYSIHCVYYSMTSDCKVVVMWEMLCLWNSVSCRLLIFSVKLAEEAALTWLLCNGYSWLKMLNWKCQYVFIVCSSILFHWWYWEVFSPLLLMTVWEARLMMTLVVWYSTSLFWPPSFILSHFPGIQWPQQYSIWWLFLFCPFVSFYQWYLLFWYCWEFCSLLWCGDTIDWCAVTFCWWPD